MMNMHTNDTLRALQNKAVADLEAQYERRMDRLDREFMTTAMTQFEYDDEVKELDREFAADFAAIFAA